MVLGIRHRQGGGARLRRPAFPVGLFALAALVASLLAPPAAASGLAAGVAASSLPQVVVSFADLGDSTMLLEGRFTTAAPRATAWDVLTDYDHIQAFVASMRSSRIKSRGDGFLMVEQVSVARVLLFQRTFGVLLKVREEPSRSIFFDDVSKASFERYEGSWTLQEVPGGTAVVYRLTAKGGLIGFATRGPSKKMVRELLEQVRAEIGRRADVSAGGRGTR